MKKLMIIAAIVCAAFASQAAAFVWKTSTTGKMYGAGGTSTYTGTAYIFADAGTTTQAAIFAMLAAGSDITDLALDSSSVSAGAISAKTATPFEYDGNINAYVAIIDGDNFFIGPDVAAAAKDVGSAQVQFNLKTSSQLAIKDVDGGFQGAGWYQSVPEPTSGLLLLLGMAGLALKRKQA